MGATKGQMKERKILKASRRTQRLEEGSLHGFSLPFDLSEDFKGFGGAAMMV